MFKYKVRLKGITPECLCFVTPCNNSKEGNDFPFHFFCGSQNGAFCRSNKQVHFEVFHLSFRAGDSRIVSNVSLLYSLSIGTRRFCDRIILKLWRVVLMTTLAGIMHFVSTSMQMVMKVEIIPSFTPALKVSIRISKVLCWITVGIMTEHPVARVLRWLG